MLRTQSNLSNPCPHDAAAFAMFLAKSSFSVLLSETEKENFVSFSEQKSGETGVDTYFTVSETQNDLYINEIYYSSENAKNYLIEKCSATSGERDFIFMPDITVNYRSLAEYTLNESDLTVFLHGDMKTQNSSIRFRGNTVSLMTG